MVRRFPLRLLFSSFCLLTSVMNSLKFSHNLPSRAFFPQIAFLRRLPPFSCVVLGGPPHGLLAGRWRPFCSLPFFLTWFRRSGSSRRRDNPVGRILDLFGFAGCVLRRAVFFSLWTTSVSFFLVEVEAVFFLDWPLTRFLDGSWLFVLRFSSSISLFPSFQLLLWPDPAVIRFVERLKL